MNISLDAGYYQQHYPLQKKEHGLKPKTAHKDSFETMFEKSAIGSLPPVRRIMSVPEKISSGDTIGGCGLVGLMLLNLPEDMKDIKSAYTQVKSFVQDKPHQHSYNYNQYQHHFSFFKGTFVDKYVQKIKNPKVKEAMDTVYKYDKSIYDTKFGNFVKSTFGIKSSNPYVGEVKDVFGNKMTLKQVMGPNKLARLTGRAMKRITLIGTMALGLIELPKICKAFFGNDEKPVESGLKQTAKSTINITSLLAGIGYGGAICAKYMGPVGSLLGMGIGAVAGSAISEKLQSKIG